MPSGPLPGAVDQSRVDAMACYLKREIVQLLPQASFAPPSAPAMQVIQEAQQKGRSWEAVYFAGAYVVQGTRQSLIWVRVQAQPPDLKPFEGEEVSTTPDGHAVYVSRWGFGTAIRLATGRSLIIVDFDPQVLTVEQAIAFANAPELDLHR